MRGPLLKKKPNDHTNKKQAEVNGVMNYKAGIDTAAGEQKDGDKGGRLCAQLQRHFNSTFSTFHQKIRSNCKAYVVPPTFGLALSKRQMSCHLQRVFSETVMQLFLGFSSTYKNLNQNHPHVVLFTSILRNQICSMGAMQ